MAADERVRLFCALRLDDATVASVAAWQETALPPGCGRVVPSDHLHLTLAFLGYRPGGDLPGICEALRDAAAVAERPLLRASRYRETRSVGMLVFDDGGGRAGAFAVDLATRLEALGVYERESRPWLAHVTVVRFRVPPRLAAPPPDFGEVSPSDAAVYSSVLRSDGAQYAVLESVALGG